MERPAPVSTNASSVAAAPASRLTPLHEAHLAAGGRLAELHGWCLPHDYGSYVDECRAVRERAGVFDVSHLTIVDLEGEGAKAWLRTLLTRDVAALEDGGALYGCLCNEAGGVLDDLIVYRLDEHRWRLVLGAAARDKDIAWLQGRRPDGVSITSPERTALLAVQGPEAVALAARALGATRERAPPIERLGRFRALADGELFVARTGYTGEDGVEIALPGAAARALWEALLAAGVVPCGHDARDTLRLEAGLSLAGVDLDEAHSPVESGLAWAVDLADPARDFVGRETIERHLAVGGSSARVGLVYDGTWERELGAGQSVQLAGRDVGIVTSGAFSPARQQSIAFARVERPFQGNCDVVIERRPLPAHTVATPFVRAGGRSSG